MKQKTNKDVITVIIPEFITHVQVTKNKWKKINGQDLYSGNMHYQTRSKIVNKMHEFLSDFIKEQVDDEQIKQLFPLRISLELHCPINYSTVSRRGGEIRWNEPKDGYKPNWDADNFWIWGKCFNDTLNKEGKIPDDNVSIIKESGSIKFVETDTFEDRKLVFILTKSN